MVWPINHRRIVEARDQVFESPGFIAGAVFCVSTLRKKVIGENGPFLSERPWRIKQKCKRG